MEIKTIISLKNDDQKKVMILEKMIVNSVANNC